MGAKEQLGKDEAKLAIIVNWQRWGMDNVRVGYTIPYFFFNMFELFHNKMSEGWEGLSGSGWSQQPPGGVS